MSMGILGGIMDAARKFREEEEHVWQDNSAEDGDFDKERGAAGSAEDLRTDPARYASLVGINMEGPFISPDRIGAQNPKFLMKPDAALLRPGFVI